MNKLPFCRECAHFGGRKNGEGICKLRNPPLVAEHIKPDFWCKDGIFKGCRSCAYEPGDNGTGRCAYCRNTHDEMGVWSEWEQRKSSAIHADSLI